MGIKFNLHIQLLKRQITGNGNVTSAIASAVVQSHDVQIASSDKGDCANECFAFALLGGARNAASPLRGNANEREQEIGKSQHPIAVCWWEQGKMMIEGVAEWSGREIARDGIGAH